MGANNVQVLTKAGLVIDCLAEETEMTAAQLAERLGEPRTTVHRLLANLEQLGFVEPGRARGAYRLGLRLFQLGSIVASRFDVRRLALPPMEHVHEETGETVFLCVRRGRDAVCIERLDGRRVQSLALQVGNALPLHAGAAPRVLLAFEPRAFWDQYLTEASLERFTDSTPTTVEELVPILEQVRESGVSVSNEDVTDGIAALGVPVFDHRGQVVAAMSISGLAAGLLGSDSVRIRQLLIDAGTEASRQLGYTPQPEKEQLVHG
jgi:DNA-binding IclR family transcriptional regulator